MGLKGDSSATRPGESSERSCGEEGAGASARSSSPAELDCSAELHPASLRLIKCRHLVCADCARAARMHQFQACPQCGASVKKGLADLKRLVNKKIPTGTTAKSASSRRAIVFE